jgi:MFS transporter, CP family, cyanate transporter
VLVIGFASFLSNHGLTNWLPKILQWHGFDPVDAGFWASIPSLVGVVGALVFSRLIPPHRRADAAAAMFATSAVAMLLIGTTTGLPLLVGLLLQGLVTNSITPILLLIMMEARGVGAGAMGAAGGLYFTVGEIGGFTGPSLLGYLFDLTGGFVVGLVLNAALLALVAAGCRRLDRERAP